MRHTMHHTIWHTGAADRRVLQPLYTRLAATIRAVDPDALFMYEPTPFPDTYPSSLPIGGVRPVGFTAGGYTV